MFTNPRSVCAWKTSEVEEKRKCSIFAGSALYYHFVSMLRQGCLMLQQFDLNEGKILAVDGVSTPLQTKMCLNDTDRDKVYWLQKQKHSHLTLQHIC